MCTTEEYILSFHILLGSWNQTRACISFTVSSLKERNVLCIKKKSINHICTKHCAVRHGKGKLTESTCI